MPALSPPRSSLCLFCAFATPRPRRGPRPLVPFVQVAHRITVLNKDRRIPDRRFLKGKPSFNPLAASRVQPVPIFTIVRERLGKLREEFVQPEFLESLQLTRKAFDEKWLSFERSMNRWIKQASSELNVLAGESRRGKKTLETRLRYLFYAQAYGGRYTKAELDNQKEVADLRYPAEWYPATREIPRTVHLHVGPTNSGKTYHALKRLEEAESGIYLGPLRLLAHEVYTRLNAKGKPCALVTGEEQRLPEGETKMWSCTVEMAPLNQAMDVAVIDEIQMINHVERGWAWTQAFLGIQAKEVHLCGEARTVPLIRQLCALVGDKVHIHEYDRLTPLKVAPRSLNGKLNYLEKGDCIVAFSVLGLHSLRREIEKKTRRKCAIVYGSLPPETRAQQARLFNDPDNDYDFLVASDAIGMGLNLSIKRVIFESTMKSDGSKLVPLQVSEIKQIAGRAGRYKTAHQAISQDLTQKSASEMAVDPTIELDDTEPDVVAHANPENTTVGYVTTLDQLDFHQLKQGMEREAPPIKTAGLFPPSLIIERFANYFPPGTPFSYIMLRLHEISTIHPRFHLCALKDQLAIADTIHTVKNLSIQDRITICAAPTNVRDEGERSFLRKLAVCIADNVSGDLLDLEGLPLEVLDEPPSSNRTYLYKLEQLHKNLVLYLWLSYRFPNVFTTRSLANHAKQLVEDAIESTLEQFSFTEQVRASIKKKREEAMRTLKQQPGQEVPREENGASALDVENVNADDIPQEVKDVLYDTQSFVSDKLPTDDADEYPIPELEVLEHSCGGDESTKEIETLQQQHNERTQEMLREVEDLTKKQAPLNIDLKADRSDAAQPRI